MRKLEVIGLLLILTSAYPLLLMGREVVAQRRAYGLYGLRRVPTNVPGFADDALTAQIGSHRVELRDDFSGPSSKPEGRAKGRVSIIIDGRDYSFDNEVEIRPFFKDQNRYHSWVKLVRLEDRTADRERVAIVQRISPLVAAGREEWEIPREELRYRILLVTEDGQVSEEIFPFQERARPPYRAMLAKYVTPFGIGFYSEALQAWPNIAYPILYPWLTAIVGFGMAAVGLVRRVYRSIVAPAH